MIFFWKCPQKTVPLYAVNPYPMITIRVGILTAPHIFYELRPHTFVLRNVRIGIGFHWDRLEDQEFEGQLEIIDNADGTKTAVNTIPLEDYLTSVISSEMRADCPMELLKAHAVIARSWAIRAMAAKPHEHRTNGQMVNPFDVCADDHCQRYEGIARRNERAIEAVRATAGQVLMYDGQVCDCRYHKCCGGKTEIFETCWPAGSQTYPYLRAVDCPYCAKAVNRKDILKTILNDYDQETLDFHDWHYTYYNKDVQDLIPLHRGQSGRIDRLKIVYQDGHEEIVGKELAIRKALSDSCLYSSWFDVEKLPTPGHFILHGHGWGHGVGLCQIGAAVMATEGATYQDILTSYYPGAHLQLTDN